MAARLQQLQQLANQAPGLAQQATAKGKDARTALLQQQLGALPTANLQQAQELQTQQATIAGQQQADVLKQSQQSAAQLGQQVVESDQATREAALQRAGMGLAERQQQAKDQLATKLQEESMASRKRVTQADIDATKVLQDRGFDMDTRLQFATERQRSDLAKIGYGVKQDLLDSRLAFDKDEIGRAFSNSRQLADYAVTEAKTQQEFDSRMRSLANAATVDFNMKNALDTRLGEILRQGYISQKGDLDGQQRVRLAEMASKVRKEAEQAKANAGNQLMRNQALGTLIGVGAVLATGGLAAPVAAVLAGGAIGGATGSVLNPKF